jgi:hypothetical protein
VTHCYRWKRYRPELYGQPCRILARGKMNSLMIEFADGTRHIVSRYAVRKIKPSA